MGRSYKGRNQGGRAKKPNPPTPSTPAKPKANTTGHQKNSGTLGIKEIEKTQDYMQHMNEAVHSKEELQTAGCILAELSQDELNRKIYCSRRECGRRARLLLRGLEDLPFSFLFFLAFDICGSAPRVTVGQIFNGSRQILHL
ncbi:hypothetical protein B0T17DRAFT_512226 [Bombardia bombarda]|uniref:Uncharacterized protein n=1 Tax=Bombardia bombarda TaxID=252184 RepID=A0AA39T0S1_9PEZI|nr:hypothetical protein B0T17DRAFT_512226 [Bombardia bombarda]